VKSGTKIYYIDYVDHKGKRRRISTNTSDKLKAQRFFNGWIREYKFSINNQDEDENEFITFEAFVVEFLSSMAPPRIAQSTYRLYEDALIKAIEVWGRDIESNDISEKHLDQYISYLANHLKIPTVNKNYRHLKAAIRQGIKWKYINPIIDWPKEIKEKKSARFLTKDQLRIFFKIGRAHV
jgi:hypothetical protein